MTYATDCALLGLDDRVILHDPNVIKKQFYERARQLHPDVEGGDRGRFEAAREAYKRLHKEAVGLWLMCPRCLGDRQTVHKQGFRVLVQTCPHCGGSGKR